MADGAPATREYDVRQIANALRRDWSAVAKRARKEGWTYREIPGRGGKRRLYGFDGLPSEVQRSLNHVDAIAAANTATAAFRDGATISRKLAIKESIDNAVVLRHREAGAARAAALTGKSRQRMEARLDLLARLDQFAQHHAMGVCAALDSFCSAYQANEIQLSDTARDVIGSEVSPATVRRWRRTLHNQGADALAGDYGNRIGTGLIDGQPELRDFFLGLLTDKPHLGGKNIHRAICARFGATAIKLPTSRSVMRYLASFKSNNAQLYTAIANPDAWKNKYMSAFGSASEDIHRLNQRWELDSTPADVMLTDGRHTIVQVVDIWSRRRSFYVSKTSSGAAVCQILRRAILAWGVPEQVKIDNGRDYVGKRVQRAFKAIDAEVLISPPFSPWKKPHVESGFKTLLHGIFELLSGYIGHDVADQQAIRASKSFAERMFKKNTVVDIRLSANDLQSFCDRWCKSVYEYEPRQGLNGQSVFQRVASWTGEVRRITDERVLDLLLAEAPDNAGGRTVTKKGIRIGGLTYIAAELHGLVGESVQVLFDERDLGRIIVHHNEAFCCIAECPEVLGVSRAEIAAEANVQRKAGVAAQRAEMQRLKRKANTKDIAFEILDAKERENAALASLPVADNVIHITPAIEAAQEAAAALEARPFDGAKELAEMNAVVELRRNDQLTDETSESRFRWALDVLMKNEDERDDLERRRLSNYMSSPEFQGRWQVFEDFGPSPFHLGDEYMALINDGAFAHRYREALNKGSF